MRFGAFPALALVLFTGCTGPMGHASKEELEKLQGTWVAVIYQELGKNIGGDEGRLKLTITGDRFTVTLEDDVKAQGTLRIDAGKSPKTIDFIDDQHVGTGIYQLYGDELKVCYDAMGTFRPSRFEVTPAGAVHLLILTRRKS